MQNTPEITRPTDILYKLDKYYSIMPSTIPCTSHPTSIVRRQIAFGGGYCTAVVMSQPLCLRSANTQAPLPNPPLASEGREYNLEVLKMVPGAGQNCLEQFWAAKLA